MMKPFKKLLILQLFLLLCIGMMAQNKKNAIQVNIGFIGLGGGIHGSYERSIARFENRLNGTVALRAGFGKYAAWGIGGEGYYVLGEVIWGHNNHHLETDLGVGAFFDRLGYGIAVNNANAGAGNFPTRQQYTDVLPYANAGYRFQKPAGWFIFRAGAGFPDGIYLGLGVAF